MKSTDNVGIAFANAVASCGQYLHVVNINLAAYQWTPVVEENKVDPDLAITARLRLDVTCAEQLWRMLGKTLGKPVPEDEPVAGVVPPDAERPADEALN